MRIIDAHLAQHIANQELSPDEAGVVSWVLSHTPTIELGRPRAQGEWVHDINNLYGCSECLSRETMSPKKLKNYCPNCGAKMNKEG